MNFSVFRSSGREKMTCKINCREKQNGFTVIEIIAVLVMIGIIAAVAVSRVASTEEYSIAAEVDKLKMNIRYAQIRALSDDHKWGIEFPSNQNYKLFRKDDDGITNTYPYNLPGDDSSQHTLPGNLSVTGATVIFDEWGRPVDTSGNPVTENIPINISNAAKPQIIITKNTGFIE